MSSISLNQVDNNKTCGYYAIHFGRRTPMSILWQGPRPLHDVSLLGRGLQRRYRQVPAGDYSRVVNPSG